MTLFTIADFREVIKQVRKDGYMSHGAGDMWEPEMREPEKEIIKIIEERLLSKAKRVYGHEGRVARSLIMFEQMPSDNRTALLIDEKEIVKECTEHSPDLSAETKCSKCGVRIEAKWELVSE